MTSFSKFCDLPPELIVLVADHLTEQDLCRLSETSKHIHRLLRPSICQAGRVYALASQEDYDKWLVPSGSLSGRRVRHEKHPIEPLAECIVNGKYDRVKTFLDFGVDPNAYTVTGARMLKCAIYHFRFDIAELLLKYGADPSLVDVGELDATVPLSAAAAAGSDHMVKRLIQAGADATAPGVLHAVAESCELETVKMVVKKGADIFALDEGSTVLHAAVRNNDYRVTAYFLDIGLDTIVSEQKRNGETALWDALYTQNAKTIRLLLDADIDLNVADRFGGTAVHQAALCALSDVVEHMMEDGVRINRGAENNESELHYAVTGGDTYIIQLLIEYGADLNWRNRDGETPLHVAALNGREDIIQQLFTAGADPTLRDIHFRTPYEAAVERGYKESARCLEIPDEFEFDWS